MGQSDTMHSHLRIAILECDALAGDIKKECGSLGELYAKFLETAASKLGESGLYERPDIELSYYDVVEKQEYPDVEKIDAVFLSGSRK
jgi:hypothetical protein